MIQSDYEKIKDITKEVGAGLFASVRKWVLFYIIITFVLAAAVAAFGALDSSLFDYNNWSVENRIITGIWAVFITPLYLLTTTADNNQ